jgi:hypothetical protein
MRLILQVLVMLALLPMDSHSSEKASNKVSVQGKVVKQVVVKTSKGQKQKCQIVLDTKTKKKYTVCHPSN